MSQNSSDFLRHSKGAPKSGNVRTSKEIKLAYPIYIIVHSRDLMFRQEVDYMTAAPDFSIPFVGEGKYGSTVDARKYHRL
jgi:hypothetical protein